MPRIDVDMSDLPVLRAYGTYARAPEVKRGIPKGVWWLGAVVVSLGMWAAIFWGLYPLLMGQL